MDLTRQLPQRGLVVVGRHAKGQLLAEFFRDTALVADGGLVVERIFFAGCAKRLAQFVGRGDVHTDQKAAIASVAARPAVNVLCQVSPASQVEVPDAKVRPFGNLQRLFQGREQRFIYVVEYSWHLVPDSGFCYFDLGPALLLLAGGCRTTERALGSAISTPTRPQ